MPTQQPNSQRPTFGGEAAADCLGGTRIGVNGVLKTAEPQNIEPQNPEGKRGADGLHLRHSEVMIRYSAVPLGHAQTGGFGSFHAGVHSARQVSRPESGAGRESGKADDGPSAATASQSG